MKDEKDFLESEIRFYEFMKNYKDNIKEPTNNSVYEKSMSGEKKVVKKQRKKLKKYSFKRLARGILIIAASLTIAITGIVKITDKIIRDNKLDKANDYMRTKIVTYLEDSDLEYSILEDKVIFENDRKKIQKFVDLLEKDGFAKHEIFYMVSQVCDKEDFDYIVQAHGYRDASDFLYENYPNGELSSSGETYIQKWGDKKVFENNIEVDYVESVNELKEKEESKGLNR